MFEYTVLPLGLYNAPTTFQRLMKSVIGESTDSFVLVYLDDILVFSTTEHGHKYYLKFVFQKLREHKLQAKLKKCEFAKPPVKYLDHIVSSGEAHVDHDKVAAATNWKEPKHVKRV